MILSGQLSIKTAFDALHTIKYLLSLDISLCWASTYLG